jgi:hypothetical protein
MKPAKLGLVLAATAFACWIAYLFYLALPRLTGTPMVVLSRPQFLVATYDVIAQVESLDGRPPQVTVQEVPWPRTEQAQALVGKTIEVTNLPQCLGWSGPGLYLLPLVSVDDQDAKYRVTETPRSPGYDKPGRPHIYPATSETRWQLGQIRGER